MSKRKKQKSRPPASPTAEEESVHVAASPSTKARPSVRARETAAVAHPLIFGRETYYWLGGGFLLVVVGFLLMTGGRGDDPSVFDESVIYSWRKITLAPILILAGLSVVTYAIFKK